MSWRKLLVRDVVNRQQLDRGDAEVAEVRDRRLGREAGVRAAQVLAHARVLLRESLHVHLVDDRVVPRRRRRPVVLPVEARVDDDALRDRVRVVLVVELEIGVVVAGSARTAATFACCHCTGPSIAFAYGSISSLFGLKRSPGRRVVRAVHAICVALSGADAGEVAVPVERRPLGQLDARLVSPSSNRHSSTRSAFSEKMREVRPAAVP